MSAQHQLSLPPALLQSSENPKRMAKVHTSSLHKSEIQAYRVEMGECIERAKILSRLTLDQFARELGRDASQVSKWFKAIEPPQVDVVLMSPMRSFFLQAMAEKTPGFQVVTTITVARPA